MKDQKLQIYRNGVSNMTNTSVPQFPALWSSPDTSSFFDSVNTSSATVAAYGYSLSTTEDLRNMAFALSLAVDHDFMAREHAAKIWKKLLSESPFDINRKAKE